MAENYVESDEDELVCESDKFKKNSFTLKWLAMRNKQVEIALQYEKLKKTESFIEDLDTVNKRISELKVGLEEAKTFKKIWEKQHIDGHICNTLLSIVGPKDSKNRKSRYSVDQVNCIKDLLQKKKNLERKMRANHKEIYSLENNIETLKDSYDGSIIKRQKHKDITFDIAREDFEKLDEKTKTQIHSRKLIDRSKMIANALCALTEHWLSLDTVSNKKQLKHIVGVCKEVTESQMQQPKEIHSFILAVHGLKL